MLKKNLFTFFHLSPRSLTEEIGLFYSTTEQRFTTVYVMCNLLERAKSCVENFIFQAFRGTLENSRWITLTLTES